MNNILSVEDGSEIYLDPRYSCKISETSYIIFSSHKNDPLVFQKSFEDTITKLCAKDLIEKGIASNNRSNIFNNPKLCNAIFNWDSSKEVESIINIFYDGSYNKVLDVGCGYGRIFLPLYDKGLDVVGIDISKSLIDYIKSKINKDISGRLICSDISSIIMPNVFDFAYASMNTLRYLESYFLLKKHFINIAYSFKKKGCYMFQVTISPNIEANYYNRWRFLYENEFYNIEWKKFNSCKIHNYIIDQVTISNKEKVYAMEYQKQLFLSNDIICNLIQDIKYLWKLDRTLDLNFKECKLTSNSRGDFWFILKKV